MLLDARNKKKDDGEKWSVSRYLLKVYCHDFFYRGSSVKLKLHFPDFPSLYGTG